MKPFPQSGLELIRQNEGLKLEAYLDQAGIWTIGYGHTVGVKPGMTWTKTQAEQELDHDCTFFWRVICDLVKAPLNEFQEGALLSFVFNIGNQAFMQSHLLKILNDGNYQAVPDAMMNWIHYTDENGKKQISNGLIKRRKAEGVLWEMTETQNG